MIVRRARVGIAAVLVAMLCACGGGSSGGGSIMPPTGSPVPTLPPGNPIVDGTRIDVDPFANAGSQHRTEVEPSAYAFGNTIVAAFQTGRFFQAGASDVDFATSPDGGATWTSGSLPGTTNIVSPGSAFGSVSDAAVAYDAKHATWLIVSLPVVFGGNPPGSPAFLVNRSTNGIAWGAAIAALPSPTETDKTWITCDTHPASPFYGNCYVEYDDGFSDGLVHVSVSSDGGLTWGVATSTPDGATGIGGQPLVRADGTVVVPSDDINETSLYSFVSHDGGATWSVRHPIATILTQSEAGGLRSSPLPGAGIDAGGTAYVAWQDCRFHAGCAFNDIAVSSSNDGVNWSPPQPLPNPSGQDRFIVGVGADAARAGRVAVTYYAYDVPACTTATCQLRAWFSASPDGGTTWSAPLQLAGPMALASLPNTSFGPMVGDYLATVYANGSACSIFVSANTPGAQFDENMYAKCTTTAAAAARAQLRTPLAVPLVTHHDQPRRRVSPPD